VKDNGAPVFARCGLPTDVASVAVMQHLEEQGLLCVDHRLRRGDRDLAVLRRSEITLLEQSGVDVDVLREMGNGAPGPAVPAADAPSTGFVSDYLDSPGIDTAFANLHALFPALTTLTDLPETTTGYDGSAAGLAGPSPVKLLRITTTPAVFSKPGLLIVAGLHAREWAPPLAAVEFASQLLQNYVPASADPGIIAINALVEGLDILIVGAGNPDGIDYSHHDEALWRKNRRPNGGAPGCPGVDNNRNFSIYWGEAGSSASPCDYQVYRGPSAFSEVENRNIRFLVEQHPNILAAVDCHSFGEKFLRPQPTGGSFIAAEPVPAPDDAIYSALEASMNAAVATVTPGKSYVTGTTSNHAGTFDEYMYFGHRIFGFELEIGADFQPPIADALVSVQEAAAAMRALAKETLGLAARFITPAAMVQVIDRSGSMVASGYVDATRRNAQRLIDLLSLNDSTALVSFDGTAATALPLTPILSAGDYAGARAAVAAIPFGGSTSIGAGLQLGVSLLPALGAARSILLLSDGFENTPPMVGSVLPGVPAGVPIHTIALGPASDQALLQQIAIATGGTYFFSPDELGLFEIYNVARGAIADLDVVLADTVSLSGQDDGYRAPEFTRPIVIECDVDYADVSIAALEADVRLEAKLRCLSVPAADLSRLDRKTGPGYLVMRLKRPQPGIYELTVAASSAGPVTCSVAAYVKSHLRLRLGAIPERRALGHPIDLHFAVRERDRLVTALSVSAASWSPAASIRSLAQQWNEQLSVPAAATADRMREEVARAQAVREHLRLTPRGDPVRHVRRSVHLIHPKLAHAPGGSLAVRAPTSPTIDGTYNVRLMVEGRSLSGCPFRRVGFRSVYVG
jgi:hypothetical protein